jgi:DNA polymerase-1
VLDHLLAKYGVERDAIITTNVVLCKTDDPPNEAIVACRPRLEAEIAKCTLVIAGGTEATTSLTRYRTVFNARPFVHHRTSSEGIKQRVIVTNNPALVIRNSDAYPDMVDDFRRAFDPPPKPVFPEVEIINDSSKGRLVLERWLNTIPSIVASDLEWQPDNKPVCAGFAARGEKSVVFGLGVINDERAWDLIRQLYERNSTRFIWHNGKADTKVLRASGIKGRVDEDTFLMSYALDERPGYHSLEYLMSTRFAWPDYEPKSVKHFKKTGEFLGKTPQEQRRSEYELYKYNGWDTAGTYQLYNDLGPRIEKEGLTKLYRRLVHAAERIKIVEENGFSYDAEAAANINDEAAIPATIELRDQLRNLSGHELLNPNSPKQMAAVYYDEFGLKHKLRDMGQRKFARSTGKEVREEILDGRVHFRIGKQEKLVRFAEAHKTYAKILKLRANYLEGLIVRVQPDGRIYCQFNIGNTVTGRASSNSPNFQNIAREGYAEIPGIRTLFKPSEGNVIVSADYSQAELRTCAKLSADESLIAIYTDSSRSLHKERAKGFYGEDYTKEEYVKSKNINFGVTYGQSAAAFAQMYHMPESEAQAYIDSWWREFPQLKAWTFNVQKQAIRLGHVQSPFGHKRRFSLITNDNINDIKREAVNFIPQNIAAWFTISALCDLVDCGIRIVATVHDSIVADVPIGELDQTASLMQEIMEAQPFKQLGWNDMPFLADISIGPSWGELTDYEMEKIAA